MHSASSTPMQSLAVALSLAASLGFLPACTSQPAEVGPATTATPSIPATPAPADPSGPNLLLITICTLRADFLGAYGHPGGNSPNIDRLAGSGVLFERALTQAPWTRPSIASLITGIYPRTLDVEERENRLNDRLLDDRFETLAERLSAAGYSTIGITANPNSNAIFNFQQGHDFFRDSGVLWRQGYGDHKISAEDVGATLLARIGELEPQQRFFAHIVLVDVHPPFLEDLAAARGHVASSDSRVDRYSTQIRYTDEVIGELLTSLSATSHADTLVAVSADHGEGFRRHHPEDGGHGRELFNSTLWVPLILNHPALVPGGSRIPQTVEVVDIMPTLLDLLGVSTEGLELEGRSLMPLISGQGTFEPLESHVVETAHAAVDKSAILSGGWKLIADHLPSSREPTLYRYESDAAERTDQARAQGETVHRLAGELERWQRDHPPRFPNQVRRAVISQPEIEHLKVLGYMTDEAAEPK